MADGHPRPATRADVARLAGVTPAVVSYVTNGGPRRVAAETERRVRDAIATLDYVPNATAQALRHGTDRAIGLVIHDIENPYYNRIASQVQEAAATHGLNVIVAATLTDRVRTLPYLRRLSAAQLSGIIVTTHIYPEQLAEVERLRARIVQLDSLVPVPGAISLQPRFADGSRALLEHLFDLGHRSIAYVGAASPVDVRHGIWLAEHARRDLEPGDSAEVPYSRTGGRDGMRAILERGRPTAVLAGSGLIAMGVLRAAREAGLRVPEDLSIVSFDDFPEVAFAFPALTALRAPLDAMARDAVEVLVTGERSAEPRWYDAAVVVRDSTGPPSR